MQKLRSVHLYLGCIFAPMLLFFAVSGIWQTLPPGINGTSRWLRLLSTVHTSHGYKDLHPSSLTSPVLMGFVVAMALGMIFTTLLGIVMAVKFGRRPRTAFYCLAFGALFPLIVITITVLSRG